MKKYIAVISVLILLIALISACGTDSNDKLPDENNAYTDEKQIQGDELPETTEPLRDSLPDDLDFNGSVINLLIQRDSWKQEEFLAEEEIGDVINDAVYRRNATVEERLNVKLNIISGPGWENWSSMANQIRASILAGDNAYHLIAGWSARAPALALDGLFMDLNELQYLELSQPWWNQSMTEEMTLAGKLHFAAGDMTMSLIQNCSVLYFNKVVQQNYALPDLYQVVLDGKWTIDYMDDLMRNISTDLDGNGIMDTKDLFGVVMEPLNVADGFLQSSNIKMTKNNASGMPYLDMEYEKLSILVDKIYKLYYENPGVYFNTGLPVEMFKNDQLLLYPGRLMTAVGSLRDMTSDYGIIPYPKYDELQEKYLSRIWDALSLMCVPMNCEKPDEIGAFMEAMGYESYITVTPAYFEIALKDKYSRDEISSQMLDIVRDGAYLNFASIYNESIGSPWHCMRQLMVAKDRNFASWYEKNQTAITQKIEAIAEKLEANQ